MAEGIHLRISSHGRIWRTPFVACRRQGSVLVKQPVRGKFLGGERLCKGYRRVNFGPGPQLIHRLVATYFVENPDNKPDINHIDGNKLNNRADNLEWVTNAENRAHAVRNGLQATGEKLSKLSREDVVKIRDLAATGMTQKRIADRYSISQQSVSKIVRRSRWIHSP